MSVQEQMARQDRARSRREQNREIDNFFLGLSVSASTERTACLLRSFQVGYSADRVPEGFLPEVPVGFYDADSLASS